MSLAKSSYALKKNIESLLTQYGIERCGFLTLTFKDNVHSIQDANSRLNSLMSNFLRAKIESYILIRERQKRGAWHFHLLAVFPKNIRKGGKFTRKYNGTYKFKTTNKYLKSIWSELREKLPLYGFGRHELLPIRKDSKSVAAYLSKYLGKHLSARSLTDKGIRLISYCQGFKRAVVPGFSWFSRFTTQMRKKVALIATNRGIFTPEQMYIEDGPTWAFDLYSQACQAVLLSNSIGFNIATPLICPGAPKVAFIDNQIHNIHTGQVYF